MPLPSDTGAHSRKNRRRGTGNSGLLSAVSPLVSDVPAEPQKNNADTAEPPDFRTSGPRDFRTSGPPDLRTSGLPSSANLVIPNGRPPSIIAFEIAVVSFFVEAADLLGVPKSVAAIYGICFASPEPLGFAEIDALLDISTGSISQGLRVLREVGALKVVSAPVERRDRFTPDLELRKLAARFLEERVDKQLKAGNTRLKTLKAAVPAGSNGSARELRDRLKQLQNWHDKSRALLPVVKTFLTLS